jgi:phosphatidylserine/phosphatidylglycerophosphate/cardiolipin synthase-like enzyme
MAGIDLNALAPKHTSFDYARQNRSTTTADGSVTIHFGDIASAVEAFIAGSDAIVGCVAWVRSRRLTTALSSRPTALVVNKEFALRVEGSPERTAVLNLRGGVPARALPAPIEGSGALDAVRCAGWAARGRFGALMHHKFLVRLTKTGRTYKPTAVWTGSFNLTAGAESNVENGMTLTDPDIVLAFLAEFARVYGISEPLTFQKGAPTPGDTKGAAVVRPKRKRTPAKAKRKPTRTRTATATKRRR